MKKCVAVSFLIAVLAFVLSFCVGATDVYSEADINNAIGSANQGENIILDVKGDIEISSKILIDKDITVTLNLGGYQLSYSASASCDSGNTVFYVSSSGATLNINGNNELLSVSDYTHYDSSKKADIVSTANVITVTSGKINIKNKIKERNGAKKSRRSSQKALSQASSKIRCRSLPRQDRWAEAFHSPPPWRCRFCLHIQPRPARALRPRRAEFPYRP